MPDAILWLGVAAVPLILGIVEVAKRAGLAARYAGVAALVLGTGLGIAVATETGDTSLLAGGIGGASVGLAAAGAWSTAKNALEER